METITKTIMDVAGEMYNNMEYTERENGDKYLRCIKDIDWQRDIIHEAHNDRLPNDDMYERIYNILNIIIECGEDSYEQITDRIYEIEADVYTSDLTKWLHDHNENVYYLTEALEEECCNDGFALLQWAQCIYIRQIGQALIDGIVKYIESGE